MIVVSQNKKSHSNKQLYEKHYLSERRRKLTNKLFPDITIKFPRQVTIEESILNDILQSIGQVTPLTEKVTFDFSNSKWIDAEMSSFIGALFEYIDSKNPDVNINITASKGKVLNMLQRNNLLHHYLPDIPKLPDYYQTSVKYDVIEFSKTETEFSDDDVKAVLDYLGTELFDLPSWQANFNTIAEATDFTGQVFEIVRNTYDHSQSSKVIISGQLFPTKDEFRLAIADIGMTIPVTVNFFELNESPAAKIVWALQPGNSSKNRKHARGLGLSTIVNDLRGKGNLTIISGKGLVAVHSNGITDQKILKFPFPGTFIRIVFDHNTSDIQPTEFYTQKNIF